MSQSSWRQSRCPWEGGKRLLGVSSAACQRWDPALPAARSRFFEGERLGRDFPGVGAGVHGTPSLGARSQGRVPAPLPQTSGSRRIRLCQRSRSRFCLVRGEAGTGQRVLGFREGGTKFSMCLWSWGSGPAVFPASGSQVSSPGEREFIWCCVTRVVRS